MKAFQFSLEKVLEWRRTQLELEEQRYRQQLAALDGIDRAAAQTTASGNAAEQQVRGWKPIAGGELAALGSFRLLVKLKETEFAVSRSDCKRELNQRENAMLQARRRVRLLENLKERRWKEWTEAQNKELEELASDAYLAKWKRRGA